MRLQDAQLTKEALMLVPSGSGEGALILHGTPRGSRVINGATGEVMSSTIQVDLGSVEGGAK